MYSVGTETTVEALLARLEAVSNLVAPDYDLSVEIAAKLLGVKWASGGMGGPILMINGGTTSEGANMLGSMDEALYVAETVGADIPFLLFSISTDLAKWATRRSARESIPYALAALLLAAHAEKAEGNG